MLLACSYIWLTLMLLAMLAGMGMVIRERKRRPRVARTWLVSLASGAAMGIVISITYARVVGGWVPISQLAIVSVAGMSLNATLRWLDVASQALARFVTRRTQRRSIHVGVAITRVIALSSIALPIVLTGVMTFRPKIRTADTPKLDLGLEYEDVRFDSLDGTRMAGWFMPAEGKTSDRTILLCHGLGAGKAVHLPLAGAFVPHGFNVLIFDFRAHGESGGQFSSFGDRERLDVIGALNYLKRERPAQSTHVYGVGISMGSAALASAAGDPRGEGIEAIALYSGFDSLPNLARDILDSRVPRVFRGWLGRTALPLASLYTAAPLGQFSPAKALHDVWPRPVLIIHGTADPVIPFDRGRALFDAASPPREMITIQGGLHDQTIADEDAAKRVREFFITARALPVI